MDPRHPEAAVVRLKQLLEQYDRIEKDIKCATVAAKLGQLEREGGLVVQEMCLVAPRIHEAMMQVSRQRRRDLNRGIVENPYDSFREYAATAVRVEEPEEESEKKPEEKPEEKTEEKLKKKRGRKKKAE